MGSLEGLIVFDWGIFGVDSRGVWLRGCVFWGRVEKEVWGSDGQRLDIGVASTGGWGWGGRGMSKGWGEEEGKGEGERYE